jgi:hypothetical protein
LLCYDGVVRTGEKATWHGQALARCRYDQIPHPFDPTLASPSSLSPPPPARAFPLLCYDGIVRTVEKATWHGQALAYGSLPHEHVAFIGCHDNLTTFDFVTEKAPLTATAEERARMCGMCLALIALSQGVVFFHAGVCVGVCGWGGGGCRVQGIFWGRAESLGHTRHHHHHSLSLTHTHTHTHLHTPTCR